MITIAKLTLRARAYCVTCPPVRRFVICAPEVRVVWCACEPTPHCACAKVKIFAIHASSKLFVDNTISSACSTSCRACQCTDKWESLLVQPMSMYVQRSPAHTTARTQAVAARQAATITGRNRPVRKIRSPPHAFCRTNRIVGARRASNRRGRGGVGVGGALHSAIVRPSAIPHHVKCSSS